MIIGVLVDYPNQYTKYARVKDQTTGQWFTVDTSELNKDERWSEGDQVSYSANTWGNDSGVAFDLKKS